MKENKRIETEGKQAKEKGNRNERTRRNKMEIKMKLNA